MRKSVGAIVVSLWITLSLAASATSSPIPRGVCWDVATCAPPQLSLHARELRAIERYANSITAKTGDPNAVTKCHATGRKHRRTSCYVVFLLRLEPSGLIIGSMSTWIRAFPQDGHIYLMRIGPWHTSQTVPLSGTS